MDIVAFERSHVALVDEQDYQKNISDSFAEDHLEDLENEYSFSIKDGDVIVACGGIAKVTEGRGVAWAYMANDLRNEMVSITRIVKKKIAESSFHRIEAYVDCDFINGHRWAKAIGFNIELERMVAFTEDRRDCSLYSIVR